MAAAQSFPRPEPMSQMRRPAPGGDRPRSLVRRAARRADGHSGRPAQQRLVITRTLAVVVALLASPVGRLGARCRARRPKHVAKDLSEPQLRATGRPLEIDSVYSASAVCPEDHRGARRRVSIVTSEDIERLRLPHARGCPAQRAGFYVTNDRNYSYLGMRGFSRPGDYNARILLLVDGHRMNDNVFGSALLGTEFALDLDLIERIEIVRGPSSSLYGTSAFFAVINVITKKGEGVGGFDVAGSLGSFGTSRGRVSFGKGFANGAQVLLSGSAYESDGQHELYYPRVRHARDELRRGPRRRRRQVHALPRQVSRRRFHGWRRCTGHATRPSLPRLSAPSSVTRERERSRPNNSSTLSTTRTLGEPLARWRAGLLRPLRLRWHLPLSAATMRAARRAPC